MFDQLSGRLEKMMKFLRGEGTVTEKNMAEALKMMRLAFLEADVDGTIVEIYVDNARPVEYGQKLFAILPGE